MTRANPLDLDAASAILLGARERQEDAIATAFPQGSELGFAVLSDGMGGHASGDLASRIIVSVMFAELTLRRRAADAGKPTVPGLLKHAVDMANTSLHDYVTACPERKGMGGTVVATVVADGQLHWISVGDSVLYLHRDGELRRLNEDHSMAPQIDLMVEQGVIDAATAASHPQRNCLTSALTGERIADIDCPDRAFELQHGDIVVVASDGLQFLPDPIIEAVVERARRGGSRKIAQDLMAAVEKLGDPEQDNTSVVVLQARDARSLSQRLPAWVAPSAMLKVLGHGKPAPAETRFRG